jgi:DNA-directed RNA polymerase III subunit RPC8
MFILSVLEDEVALHPSRFGKDRHVTEIRTLLEKKYIDRVIPDVGLVVALYDIISVRDAYIFPGDLKDSQGDAACTVRFRLAVFRPKVGELLLGRIVGSTPMGLQVSLGFFHDISIPVINMRNPSVFDERLGVWNWQFKADSSQPPVQYPYSMDGVVCVRVKSIQFLDSAVDGARRALALQKDSKPSTEHVPSTTAATHYARIVSDEPPMLVVASVEEDGFGLLSWWIS